MKLNLLAVGNKMPAWVVDGYQEYTRRLPRECSLQIQEITPAKRGKTGSPLNWMREEGERILAAIPDSNHAVALDVQGQKWSTEQLAKQLQAWMADGRDVSLLVGGPDGLSKACLQQASQKWSLSAMTLPHPLVRIVIAEQLYRAWTILQNHPYHRS